MNRTLSHTCICLHACVTRADASGHLLNGLFGLGNEDAHKAAQQPEEQPVDSHTDERCKFKGLVWMERWIVYDITKGEEDNFRQSIDKCRENVGRIRTD